MQHPSMDTAQTSFQRALFIFNLHLGARGWQPDAIIKFMKARRIETIYLVGDIFKFLHVGKIYWSKAHDEIITELNRLCHTGIRMIYLVRNHDWKAREVVRKPFQKVGIKETVLHHAANQKTYLVANSNQPDNRVFRFHFMTLLGRRVDALLRSLDIWLNSNVN